MTYDPDKVAALISAAEKFVNDQYRIGGPYMGMLRAEYTLLHALADALRPFRKPPRKYVMPSWEEFIRENASSFVASTGSPKCARAHVGDVWIDQTQYNAIREATATE